MSTAQKRKFDESTIEMKDEKIEFIVNSKLFTMKKSTLFNVPNTWFTGLFTYGETYKEPILVDRPLFYFEKIVDFIQTNDISYLIHFDIEKMNNELKYFEISYKLYKSNDIIYIADTRPIESDESEAKLLDLLIPKFIPYKNTSINEFLDLSFVNVPMELYYRRIPYSNLETIALESQEMSRFIPISKGMISKKTNKEHGHIFHIQSLKILELKRDYSGENIQIKLKLKSEKHYLGFIRIIDLDNADFSFKRMDLDSNNNHWIVFWEVDKTKYLLSRQNSKLVVDFVFIVESLLK
jgi:hypothetical protein